MDTTTTKTPALKKDGTPRKQRTVRSEGERIETLKAQIAKLEAAQRADSEPLYAFAMGLRAKIQSKLAEHPQGEETVRGSLDSIQDLLADIE